MEAERCERFVTQTDTKVSTIPSSNCAAATLVVLSLQRNRPSPTGATTVFRKESTVTHGWPGSISKLTKVIGPLTDPTAYGGRAAFPPRLTTSI
jgi:hypothetical protein